MVSSALVKKVFLVFSLCFFVALFPWWAIVMLIIALLFLFDSFYSGIVVGFFMDMVYGVPSHFEFRLPFFMIILGLSFLIPWVKHRFIFWNEAKY